MCKKAECFVHYSFVRSDKELMVLDIQGCDYYLFDPEVATKESFSDGEFLFCTGNLSTNAITNFSSSVCNDYCNLLGLTQLQQS